MGSAAGQVEGKRSTARRADPVRCAGTAGSAVAQTSLAFIERFTER
jgi:hypothetical protein